MSKKQIDITFETLLEHIENVVSDLNELGSRSIKQGDYDRARNNLRDAEGITFFRQKAKKLQTEWKDLFFNKWNEKDDEGSVFESLKDDPRGIRTQDDQFRQPILESIIKLEGSGEMEQILDLVEKKMKKILNDYDREEIPLKPPIPRWKNTAAWCRASLVTEGILKSDSPYGVWEITEKGKAIFTKSTGKSSETDGKNSEQPKLPKMENSSKTKQSSKTVQRFD